jgi:hypothetical protein
MIELNTTLPFRSQLTQNLRGDPFSLMLESVESQLPLYSAPAVKDTGNMP